MEGLSHYAVLEVTEAASAEQIKAAYRRLAREYHPDSLPPDVRDRRIAKDAEERFKQIQAAYDVLSDPERRRRYNASRRPDGDRERESARPSSTSTANASSRPRWISRAAREPQQHSPRA